MKTPSLLEAAANCDAWCEQRLKANYDARRENRRLKAGASLATESETASKISIEQYSQKSMPQVRREENTTNYREVDMSRATVDDCCLEEPICLPCLLVVVSAWVCGWYHIFEKPRPAGADGPSMSGVRDTSRPASGAVSERDSVPPSSSMSQQDPAPSCTLYEVD
jgi:hypothetical protein